MPLTLKPGDLADPRVAALIALHATTARAATAPGSDHALDVGAFQSPDIALWTLWDGDALVATGALLQLSPREGEVKAMHTVQSRRRAGAGSVMLRHLIALARERGFDRLYLETGSWDYFQPARAFYGRHGFVVCPPFAGYVPDPNSVFMWLEIATQR